MCFLFGENVCTTALKHFTKVTAHKYYRHMADIEEGRTTPFLDDRGNNGPIPSIQNDVDNFCTYLYEFVAEPLADTDDGDDFQDGLGRVRKTKPVPWTSGVT